MPSVSTLCHDDLRDALDLLGLHDGRSTHAGAVRALSELLAGHGTVRATLGRAPEGARQAFVTLAHDGFATVESLLGRGWWGHGALPPPLDWLQKRAFVVVGEDGLVYPTDEARGGFLDLRGESARVVRGDSPNLGGGTAQERPESLTLDVDSATADDAGGLRVERAGCVVVAGQAATLDRALTVSAAGLRAVAPTVALSRKPPSAVTAALRAAGVRLDADTAVVATQDQPALPGTSEDAVAPRALRALLGRAVTEQRQVRLQYFASSRGGAATERVVDPWSFREDLLRGWCHLRTDERTFAVDRIGRARLLPTPIDHEPGG